LPVCLIKEYSILQRFEDINAIRKALKPFWDSKRTIGLIPTMGALHDGHMSLLRQAKQECDVVVVTIFVNPTQFNNSGDLENYPRTIDEDLALLREENCDFVFLPTVDEVYPKDYENIKVDLSPIDEVMEGVHRPGHFEGVANVVSRFFKIIEPQKAYFGRKDFQQVIVVEETASQLNLPVEIVPVETLRAPNGLALSSRNKRLSEDELEKASIIYKTLSYGKELVRQTSPKDALNKMKAYFENSSLELEYLDVVDPKSVASLTQYWVPGTTACIAAFCGEVRLIDNMELVPND
jgi:pantoate--beta-alanine ligase